MFSVALVLVDKDFAGGTEEQQDGDNSGPVDDEDDDTVVDVDVVVVEDVVDDWEEQGHEQLAFGRDEAKERFCLIETLGRNSWRQQVRRR